MWWADGSKERKWRLAYRQRSEETLPYNLVHSFKHEANQPIQI
jgi:hypothetical protein